MKINANSFFVVALFLNFKLDFVIVNYGSLVLFVAGYFAGIKNKLFY